jgi:uncharacterized repeat protein (TIGR04002 family)
LQKHLSNKDIKKPDIKTKPSLQKRLRTLTAAAVFAAVTMIMTAFIHVPAFFGYIHPGDAVIFLGAALLPAPFAAAAAGIGAGFADLIAGYPLYIPATVIIKAVMTIPFSNKGKIIDRHNSIAAAAAVIIGAGGYLLYDFFIYGAGAISALPLNIVQEIISVIIFICLGLMIDRSGIKKFLTF